MAGVSDLAAHLSVERSPVEHELEHLPVLLLHAALPEQPRSFHRGAVIAHELLLAREIFHPVAELVGCGVPRALLLLEHLGLEALDVHAETVFGGDELCQVEREAVGVIEQEGVLAGYGLVPAVLLHMLLNELDTPVEGAEECGLLLAYHALYELLLRRELRIGLAHVRH